MKRKTDEVWYCENSKGHKIPPYGDSYHVPKPKPRFERILNIIGTMIGLTLAGFILLTLFSFTTKIDCGEQIGSYNTIPVYYNDGFHSCDNRHWSEDGEYMYGMKWQCVEFVRRYYYDYFGHAMPNRWGNAADYFRLQIPSGELNTERNLIQYHNGDTKPQVNDILVWGASTGGYGHVAIVTAVMSDGVKIIGQNTGKYCNNFLKLKEQDGKYIIDKGRCDGILRIRE